jgi:hypothetical protein
MNKSKKPMTAADHEINRLRNKVRGHETLIKELQEALKVERRAVLEQATKVMFFEQGLLMASQISQQLLAALDWPEDNKDAWRAKFPGLLGQPTEKQSEDNLEV